MERGVAVGRPYAAYAGRCLAGKTTGHTGDAVAATTTTVGEALNLNQGALLLNDRDALDVLDECVGVEVDSDAEAGLAWDEVDRVEKEVGGWAGGELGACTRTVLLHHRTFCVRNPLLPHTHPTHTSGALHPTPTPTGDRDAPDPGPRTSPAGGQGAGCAGCWRAGKAALSIDAGARAARGACGAGGARCSAVWGGDGRWGRRRGGWERWCAAPWGGMATGHDEQGC